jgi:hypothetical protein
MYIYIDIVYIYVYKYIYIHIYIYTYNHPKVDRTWDFQPTFPFFTAWGHDLGTTCQSSPRWDSWLERFVEPPPNITLRVMDCPWPGQIYRGSCVTPKNGSDGQVGLGLDGEIPTVGTCWDSFSEKQS